MAKMKKKELEFFRNLVNEKKETLLKELGYYEENNMKVSNRDGTGDLSGVSHHLADQGSDSHNTEQALRLASREGKYLIYLEEALRKINDGTYGICVSCKKTIPHARLEAVPTAKMCIDCKRESKKQGN